MAVEISFKEIDDAELFRILSLEESHFVDLKSSQISPAKLSRTISAFANTSGGEIFVGIEELDGPEGKFRNWDGFVDQEAANPIFQVMDGMDSLNWNVSAEFIKNGTQAGLVLHLTILKTARVAFSTEGKAYVRRSAQNLPVSTDGIERLQYDKGIKSFEDEIAPANRADVENSEAITGFLMDTIPTGEPIEWLDKQRLIANDAPIVAAVLLYSDNPQAILPKRSSIKVLRYQTKKEAERDFLAADPETIEGPLYNLIYDAVDRIKAIIESIERAGPKGLEKISYPEEALHELLTNAILHRDYSVTADVQVRIFDNRVEIESPGKLPGHVTIHNIAKTQFARNPKIVRLVNKFKNPPNKDVGEGINTAYEAMEKLRLKKPVFEESDGSLIVTLRHESLASPEQMVMEYLRDSQEITNQIARELTGIKSENSMKQVFYKLREAGQLEQVPKVAGKKPAWRKPLDNGQVA